jgi:hypothetical protein
LFSVGPALRSASPWITITSTIATTGPCYGAPGSEPRVSHSIACVTRSRPNSSISANVQRSSSLCSNTRASCKPVDTYYHRMDGTGNPEPNNIALPIALVQRRARVRDVEDRRLEQGDRRSSNPRPSEPQPNVRYSQVFTTAKPYEQDGNCPYLFPPVCFPPPPIGVSTGVLNISLPLGQRSSTRSDVTRSMRSSQRKVRHTRW